MKPTWTQFWDMHSGGDQKLEWPQVYIEAPQEQAVRVFYARFHRNPNRVTCTCCGEDYSISEFESLEQATGFHRGCAYGHFDPKGNEVPKEKATKEKGFGLKRGYTSGYVERADPEHPWAPYVPLAEFLKTVKVIRASEISSGDLAQEPPEEGFVWRD